MHSEKEDVSCGALFRLRKAVVARGPYKATFTGRVRAIGLLLRADNVGTRRVKRCAPPWMEYFGREPERARANSKQTEAITYDKHQ